MDQAPKRKPRKEYATESRPFQQRKPREPQPNKQRSSASQEGEKQNAQDVDEVVKEQATDDATPVLPFVDIDGSYGEGGGQVLRNSTSLSAILQKPIKVTKIRAGRAKPGLATQHMTGLILVSRMCQGDLDGAKVGSTSISLRPRPIKAGKFEADTKTAGSISLLIQVALPCMLFAPGPVHVTLKGGTNATMAPQIDYIEKVFSPIATKMGISFDLQVHTRGYFPRGGGVVTVATNPLNSVSPIVMEHRGDVQRIEVSAAWSGHFPEKLMEKICAGAINHIRQKIPDDNIVYETKMVREPKEKSMGDGASIIIIATTSTGCILAGSAIAEKRKKEDAVGIEAAQELIDNLSHGGCFDEHLQDQLIIFMALAGGHSKVKVGPLTEHTRTSIHFSEMLTGAKFSVTEAEQSRPDEKCFWIECDGVGFTNHLLD